MWLNFNPESGDENQLRHYPENPQEYYVFGGKKVGILERVKDAENTYVGGLRSRLKNPKPETRNPNEITSPKPQVSANLAFLGLGVLGIHSDFWFLVSGFF
jgi:hypothetical protein